MKSYYELLGVDIATPADDIKRAFRREIARYHPDKVQHLGPEFQEIAATRAAELTEAYRILMDPEARRTYDTDLVARQELAPAAAGAATVERAPAADPVAPRESHVARKEPAGTPVPESLRQTQATLSDFVKRATLARVRTCVQAVLENATALSMAGFDLAYDSKSKGGLFRKSEPPVRLLAKIVACVDRSAVQDFWPRALKAAVSGSTLCVLLIGSGVAPADDLSSAVSELRRRTRGTAPVLVPVDFRDWEALFPPETPAVVRTVIQMLKQQK